MVGRRRKHNKHLPRRVELHHGSYRYLHKDGKKTTLAKADDYSGMLRALASFAGFRPSTLTLGSIMDRYELEVLPGKAEQTQKDQARQLKLLRGVFGMMEPDDLRQPHAYDYVNRRACTAPTAAARELELLSHICTMAVRWGAMRGNPISGMEKPRPAPRRRYVTNAEYIHVWNLASPMVQCVMDLAMLTGLRRGDIFRLERRCMTEDGIEIQTSKTGAAILFEWSSALRETVQTALKLPPQVRQNIVCNRKGKAYTKNGFDSVWQRLMDKATAAGMERFEFRDLRRKSASDDVDDETASKRLGHTNSGITKRVYRVRPNRVRPLR